MKQIQIKNTMVKIVHGGANTQNPIDLTDEGKVRNYCREALNSAREQKTVTVVFRLRQ
jgi:hypothetical protein